VESSRMIRGLEGCQIAAFKERYKKGVMSSSLCISSRDALCPCAKGRMGIRHQPLLVLDPRKQGHFSDNSEPLVVLLSPSASLLTFLGSKDLQFNPAILGSTFVRRIGSNRFFLPIPYRLQAISWDTLCDKVVHH
jgi:hypothetical protein